MPMPENTYDAIPYRSVPFPQTRPERLAAIAKLFGLDAPPIETCRVLELGCGSGGNIISLAHDYPDSRCLGVDASSVQIADGWNTIEALGLKNIQLKHRDILTLGAELGEFDFIICHGVFSWVPPAVQERILEICRQNLAPNGVAYVSYNTYPGWHIRGIVRDMMRYHGLQFHDPAVRLAQAKALVRFVADSGKVQDSRYKRLLRDEFAVLSGADDSYLHHEHLEENNRPIYFHEFARMLAVNGLQYLGEAEFSTMISTNFAPEIAETLNRLGAHDILQMEQYMDFVRCRYFRQTLICRKAVALRRQLGPESIGEWHLASRAVPTDAAVSFAPGDVVEFKVAGSGLNCRSPLTKAAFLELAKVWPEPIVFSELFEKAKAGAVAKGFSEIEGGTRDFFAGEILSGMAAGLIEWRLSPVRYQTKLQGRPIASALARHQAGLGKSVANLRGEPIELDEMHRQVLRRLNGVTNREQLIDHLLEFLKSGDFILRRDGDNAPVTDELEKRQLLSSSLEKLLANLATFALISS
ncbi:MAG TPA: class I SAM-dependent methyltransferase [Urbifossiella sp.]|jgi:methyltransferase-like protein/2-polyprenyl-3-methyl-5-hydroxy-6-metoxy-1,4-benzoquinol methylase